MRRNGIFKKTGINSIFSGIMPIMFTLVIMLMILYGLNQTERSSNAEGLRILEDGIRRAAVTCYAIEGFYPDSIAYIEENYGIHINRAKYIVHYDIFASNIFPDITVLER